MAYKYRTPYRKAENTVQRPRLDLTCPTCKRPNALTTYEASKKYQCRDCTAREEGF